MSHRAYLGLGANLGDAAGTVKCAIEELAAIGTVAARSSLYHTPPWGKTDQPAFVNAVVLLQTELAPRDLLNALQAMENRHGRQPSERWAARTLDVDILTYDDATVDELGLQIPHPHLHERAFVLVPLAEIDPAYTAMRDSLPEAERSGIVILSVGA